VPWDAGGSQTPVSPPAWWASHPPAPAAGPRSPGGCPLPRAAPGAAAGGDTAGSLRPHLLFAASPGPAFGRLQVTASQGSLKALCCLFFLFLFFFSAAATLPLNRPGFFSPCLPTRGAPWGEGSLPGLSEAFIPAVCHTGISSVLEVWLMQQFNGFVDLCPRFSEETCKVEAEFCCCLKRLRGTCSEVVLPGGRCWLMRSH